MTPHKMLRFVLNAWTSEHALRWIWNIMTLVHAGLGVAVLAGGPERFSFPTYQPLVDMTNGETWIWGAWVLAAAGLMTVPARWPQIVGLWLGMAWSIMWCALFAIAVVTYPTAGATACIAYGGFAMIDAALLTARIIDRETE